MIMVFLQDGECVEVEAAVGAAKKADLFVCFDADGREVANFPFYDVQAYTMSDIMAESLQEEVCDEVTLIPADRVEGEDEGLTATP
jgi:hypothetical protein